MEKFLNFFCGNPSIVEDGLHKGCGERKPPHGDDHPTARPSNSRREQQDRQTAGRGQRDGIQKPKFWNLWYLIP